MAIADIAGKRVPVLEQGPAFTALSERERRFVLAMLANPFGNAVEWVKAAGYSCRDGAKVTGHRVLHRARVEAAVFEVARSLLTTEGPLLAIAGLIEIARDRGHRQRLRALETLANRTGLHELTEHRVKVEHTEESAEAKVERIKLVAVREVGEVGRCTFNRETQVEHCEKRLIKPDGSIMLGTTESRYSFDDGKTLKMTATPKMVTDTPFTNAPFDAFPVHCPDDVVWGILNEVGRSR